MYLYSYTQCKTARECLLEPYVTDRKKKNKMPFISVRCVLCALYVNTYIHPCVCDFTCVGIYRNV